MVRPSRVVVELEGAGGEVAEDDVLRRAARVADALQAHAVLVAPERRRAGGAVGAAEQRARDGGAAARGGLPVAGARHVARGVHAREPGAAGLVDRHAGRVEPAAGEPAGGRRDADPREHVGGLDAGAVGELERVAEVARRR